MHLAWKDIEKWKPNLVDNMEKEKMTLSGLELIVVLEDHSHTVHYDARLRGLCKFGSFSSHEDIEISGFWQRILSKKY